MKKLLLSLVSACIILTCFSTPTFEIPQAHANIGDTINNEFFEHVGAPKGQDPVLRKDFLNGETPNADTGVAVIGSAFNAVTNYWKHIAGIIAVLMITVAGFRMTVAGEEDEINNQKNIILWCIVGLVVILGIDVAVTRVFYGSGPQLIFDQGQESVVSGALEGRRQIEAFIDYFLSFVGALSVLMIFISGIRLILAFGQEDVINKEKSMIFWVAVGLIMIGLSKVMVNTVYTTKTFGEFGVQPGDPRLAIAEIAGVLQFALVFVGVGAFLVLVYGGFLLVLQWGNEDAMDKAKQIVTSAIIGLVIIFTSFAVVSTVISARSVI